MVGSPTLRPDGIELIKLSTCCRNLRLWVVGAIVFLCILHRHCILRLCTWRRPGPQGVAARSLDLSEFLKLPCMKHLVVP